MYLIETLTNDKTARIALYILISIGFFLTKVNAAPADSIKVNARNGDVNASSIYEVYFSISTEIPASASIVVIFPDDFGLSNVNVAGSTTINGGFELTVNQKKVILKRSGHGDVIEPDQQVSVKFANVKNPPRSVDQYEIDVEIRDNDNQVLKASRTRVNVEPVTRK